MATKPNTANEDKRNLTLHLSGEIIRRAKILAAQRGISLSQWFAETVAAEARQERSYDRAKKQALGHMARGFRGGGGPLPTRDEFYED